MKELFSSFFVLIGNSIFKSKNQNRQKPHSYVGE